MQNLLILVRGHVLLPSYVQLGPWVKLLPWVLIAIESEGGPKTGPELGASHVTAKVTTTIGYLGLRRTHDQGK